MNRGGLNFFLALYIIIFLLLITPFGALFFLIFGKLTFFIALSLLILAIVTIYMQRQETITGSKLVDLIILMPVMVTIIVGRLLWVKLNNKEIGSTISNGEIFLYLFLLMFMVGVVLLLDKKRSEIK